MSDFVLTVGSLLKRLSKVKDQSLPIAMYIGDDEYAREVIGAKQIKLLDAGLGLVPYYPQEDREYIMEAKRHGEDLKPVKYFVLSDQSEIP